MSKQKKPIVVPPLSTIYRKIAISFVVLTVLLVGIIVFFSMSKATVVITPKKEIRSAEFLVTVIEGITVAGDGSGTISGKYEEKIMEEIERQIRPTEMRLDSVGVLSAVGLGIKGHRTRVSRILFAALDEAGIEQLGGMQGYDGISETYIFNSCELDKAISVAHKALIEDRKPSA